MAGALWTAQQLQDVVNGTWVCVGKPPNVDAVAYQLVDNSAGPRPGVLMVLSHGPGWTASARTHSRQQDLTAAMAAARAVDRGAVAVLTATPLEGVPSLVVEDTHAAMWQLAERARSRFIGTVVAVTGTVGKSTTRTFLAHALGGPDLVGGTSGNRNTYNQIGVAIANLPAQAPFGVFECSITALENDGPPPLATTLRPDCAVVTSIGLSQTNRYPTTAETLRFKGRLVEALGGDGLAVVNRDTGRADELLDLGRRHALLTIGFGRHHDADVRLHGWDFTKDWRGVALLEVAGERCSVELPRPGPGMAMNAAATIAVALGLGIPWREVAASLATVRVGRRVIEPHEIPVAGGSALLFDDSHNATEESMGAAFEVISHVPATRKIAVIGQMVRLGKQQDATYARLAAPLLDAGVDRVVTVGKGMEALRDRLPDRIVGLHAPTPQAAARAALDEAVPGAVILVKGSHRGTEFRKVARLVRRGAVRSESERRPSSELPT